MSALRTPLLIPDAAVREFVAGGFCGRLGLQGPDGWPYVVPLLYVWLDGEIWLHNSRAPGHLRACVDHEARVCFEIDEPGQVFPYGRFECDSALEYRSVVAFGRIRIVAEAADSQRFCEALMARYGNPDWSRPRGVFPRLDQITVYAIAIERMTGKQTSLPAPADQWPAKDNTKTPQFR